jgi:hypothetical protein
MRRQFYAGRGEEVPEGLDQGGPCQFFYLRSDTTPEADIRSVNGLGMLVTDDEHTRALEEQWIEGDLTHETAQSKHPRSMFIYLIAKAIG